MMAAKTLKERIKGQIEKKKTGLTCYIHVYVVYTDIPVL